MIAPTRSLTRRETELAHRLALGMALAGRTPAPHADRNRLILREVRRLLARYRAMDDVGLADHVHMYSLPGDYSEGPHSLWCGAFDGEGCTCRPEADL